MNLQSNPKVLPLAVLLLGSFLAVADYLHRERANEAERQARFDSLSLRAMSQLLTRMRTYEYGLRGARGAVIGAGGESITREAFLRYSKSRDLSAEFPGARGFGTRVQSGCAAAEALPAPKRPAPGVSPGVSRPSSSERDTVDAGDLGRVNVARVADAHGGSVVLQSRPGDARFVVRLPLVVPGR